MHFVKENYIHPLSGLVSQWLDQADDGTVEFRLASSIAGIQASTKREIGPMRSFLEEVTVMKFVNWSPGSTSAVWSKQPLARNLAAVFRRRQMESFRAGFAGVPLVSPRSAKLDDVIAFLRGDTDDDKLHDLIWGLIAIEYPSACTANDPNEREVPFEFGVPRLLVQERSFVKKGKRWKLSNDEPSAKPDPDVFHLLVSGQSDAVEQCITRAAQRLMAGGLLVNGYRNRRLLGQPISITSVFHPERLLAAMLFPLSDHDLTLVANSVLYPPETQE
jgi:CRISPR-associated protein Csx17